MSLKLEKLGYSPINFRFYKIFDRKTKDTIDISVSEKMPIFEIFYLYVDLVLDEEIQTRTTFLSDPLLKFCFENNLWVKENNFKIIKPEPLVLTKLRMLKERDSEKRIKDILDCIMVLNFSNFDTDFFQEVLSIFKTDKNTGKLTMKIINSPQIGMELSDLRFSIEEIQNARTTSIAMLKL